MDPDKITLKPWKSLQQSQYQENFCDSYKEVKASILTGVWNRLLLTLMDGFEEFQTSVEGVTEDVMEVAREVKLEVNLKS